MQKDSTQIPIRRHRAAAALPKAHRILRLSEVTRRIYDALRDAPDFRAQDLADAAVREKGLPDTDRAQHRELVNRFLNVMGDMKRRSNLVKIGRVPAVRFKLAPWEPELSV
jgi:hypothetical protein